MQAEVKKLLRLLILLKNSIISLFYIKRKAEGKKKKSTGLEKIYYIVN